MNVTKEHALDALERQHRATVKYLDTEDEQAQQFWMRHAGRIDMLLLIGLIDHDEYDALISAWRKEYKKSRKVIQSA